MTLHCAVGLGQKEEGKKKKGEKKKAVMKTSALLLFW